MQFICILFTVRTFFLPQRELGSFHQILKWAQEIKYRQQRWWKVLLVVVHVVCTNARISHP